MSASEANRDLVYYTFNEADTAGQLNALSSIIDSQKMTVGEVYGHILSFCDHMYNRNARADFDTFSLLNYFENIFGKETSKNDESSICRLF